MEFDTNTKLVHSTFLYLNQSRIYQIRQIWLIVTCRMNVVLKQFAYSLLYSDL